MKRRAFLLQSGAGLAAAALPGLAHQADAQQSANRKAAASARRPAEARGSVVHPGILQTRADLEFMKAKIKAGEDPWKSGWALWLADPDGSLDFEPQPFAHIVRGAYGAGQKGANELMTSARAVNSHVLQWYVTEDEAHARKAIEILDAWSGTLADFFENDAMLLAGWTGGEFCNAAEILRATYPKWSVQSQTQFKRMLRTVYVPLLRMFYPGANGNWDAAIMYTLLSIGVFCDDRELRERVYEHYRIGPINSGITRYVYPSGQCEETTRDQGHVQLGLGYMARTALVAWNQGVDLFGEADNRLALGYEYTARYMLGEDVPVYGKVSQQSRGRFSDIYEMVLQHYRYQKHIEMPYTARAAMRARATSHSVVTNFRGDSGKAPAGLFLAPTPSKIAAMTGAQATPSAAAPANAIPVAPGDSVQDAVNRAVAAGGPGVVSLAAGLHTLPASLSLPSGITIVGTGIDCEVFLDPAQKGWEAAIVNAAPDLHDVVLRDFVIEGAETPQTSRDPNSDVQHRRVLHGPIRGGIVFQSDGKSTLRNLHLERLTVRNCTYNAVELFGADKVEIVNCDFSASGGLVPPGAGKNHNLKMNHVSNANITGCRLSDSMAGHGVAVIFGNSVDLRNCELARNELSGVLIAECRDVTVEACLAEGNSDQGIAQETWMDANRNLVLRNNTLRNNAVNG